MFGGRLERYEVKLPNGQVIAQELPAGLSDKEVRGMFASRMRKHGIDSGKQAVLRPKPKAEMKEHKPTVAERLGDYIGAALSEIGLDQRHAYRLGNKLEGVFSNFTPVGNWDDFQRAENDFEKQLAILPLPGPAKRAIRKGIRAWHGSPHDFDKFDLNKIGTGEGAQAYGHGLYFAENPKVAADYRNTLAMPKIDGREMRMNESDAWGALSGDGGDIGRALSRAEAELAARRARGVHPLDLEPLADRVGTLRAWQKHGMPQITDTGRLYEVNINASPDEFLDWDAPTAPFGGELYSGFADRFGSYRGDLAGRRAATEELRKRGIPGIKYLDQGSRGTGQGTRNYVVFDDSLIDIINKY